MSLITLAQSKRLVVIGLNSGTSADAVDAAAVAIEHRGARVTVKCVATSSRKIPVTAAERIFSLADSATTSLDEVIYLDNVLGRMFSEVAVALMRRMSRRGVKAHLIASHGQTVRHLPGLVVYGGRRVRGTMQLGSIDQIAAGTGLPTVGDFRQADIASGGEGAPITAGAMWRTFGDRRESRLIVNIGGMSNYFYFPSERVGAPPRALDCGPGNSLCDGLARRLFDRPCDRGGRLARSGRVSERLLSQLLSRPFFSDALRSTGREQFGSATIREILAYGRRQALPDVDLMHTAAELTARSIAMSVAPLIRRDRLLAKLYLTGGGRRNTFMVNRLRHHLTKVEIVPIEELGANGDFVEAIAYAVLGEAAIRSESLPTLTATRQRPILGRIAQPPRGR